MDKRALRARMKAKGPVDPEVGGAVTTHLRRFLAGRLPGTVAAYLALSDEVDVSPLFTALPGWRWVLPRVEPDGSLTFRDLAVPREVHPLGMQQPRATGVVIALHEIDVFLVPGIAYDRSGGRLGRGGGHYDRILSRRRRDSLAIGVTIESRLLDTIPREVHDESVDMVVTEKGVGDCSPTR